MKKDLKRMKVSIIGGGGVVGSSAAYRIAQDGMASEIVLVDVQRNLAEAHAFDIEQGVVHRATAQVYAGEIEDTRKSDVVIIAVSGQGRMSKASRAEFLPQNLPTVKDLVEDLLPLSPSALWIIATAPVDPLVYLIHRIFSIPREKMMGLNRNDTSRFRWALSKFLSKPSPSVEAYVLGEHGETQVLLFSQVRIDGEKISLKAEQREIVRDMATDFLSRWRKWQPGRTAGWTTAESIGDIFRSIVSEDGCVWTCSTPLAGEYGLKDVSLGVPVRVGPQGVKEIIQFNLDPEESRALEISSATVKEHIRQGEVILHQLETNPGNVLREG